MGGGFGGRGGFAGRFPVGGGVTGGQGRQLPGGGIGLPPASAGGLGFPGRPGGFGAGPPFGVPGPGANGVPGGAGAGFLTASTPGPGVVRLLETKLGSFRWVAATVNSNSAAGYQLSSGGAVMAIGGFNGTDPAPSLAQFERYVRQGNIHYFIAGRGGFGAGMGGAPGGGTTSTSSRITRWVESHYTSKTVDGTVLYDLTAAPTS